VDHVVACDFLNDDQKAGILGDTAARVLQIAMDETASTRR
jgi:hypothetical protein